MPRRGRLKRLRTHILVANIAYLGRNRRDADARPTLLSVSMPEDEHSTDPSADCIQRAYLYLTRDLDTGGPPLRADEIKLMAFDPDDVTRLVRLQPTTAWRRGDLHPGLSERRRSSNWEYELAKVRTYFTEGVVTRLLDAIEPHAAGITEACAALGMRAGINVVIEMIGDRNTASGNLHVSTAAITYTAQTLKRLAQLDLSVDHDQYVFLPD